MNDTATSEIAYAPEPVPTSTPAPAEAFRLWFVRLNAWLETHMDRVMGLVVLAGFCLRFWRARAAYLNADEAQIMLPALRHGLVNTYKAAQIFPYGPLMNLVLHFMTFFGSSELYFRMPSVIAGTLLIFVGYKWVAETFGKGAGMVTGCILAFAPPMVILSAQVRHYMPHALLVACSLYCLERALREKSRGWMRYFGVAVLLAVLTMYMSIWYIAALGVYAIVCFLLKEIPRPVIVEWIKTQAAVAFVLIVAYTTHLHKLRGDKNETRARDGWLRSSYFHPESQSAADYLRQATDNLFGYVFGRVDDSCIPRRHRAGSVGQSRRDRQPKNTCTLSRAAVGRDCRGRHDEDLSLRRQPSRRIPGAIPGGRRLDCDFGSCLRQSRRLAARGSVRDTYLAGDRTT
jgi:hypothetical protein